MRAPVKPRRSTAHALFAVSCTARGLRRVLGPFPYAGSPLPPPSLLVAAYFVIDPPRPIFCFAVERGPGAGVGAAGRPAGAQHLAGGGGADRRAHRAAGALSTLAHVTRRHIPYTYGDYIERVCRRCRAQRDGHERHDVSAAFNFITGALHPALPAGAAAEPARSRAAPASQRRPRLRALRLCFPRAPHPGGPGISPRGGRPRSARAAAARRGRGGAWLGGGCRVWRVESTAHAAGGRRGARGGAKARASCRSECMCASTAAAVGETAAGAPEAGIGDGTTPRHETSTSATYIHYMTYGKGRPLVG